MKTTAQLTQYPEWMREVELSLEWSVFWALCHKSIELPENWQRALKTLGPNKYCAIYSLVSDYVNNRYVYNRFDRSIQSQVIKWLKGESGFNQPLSDKQWAIVVKDVKSKVEKATSDSEFWGYGIRIN